VPGTRVQFYREGEDVPVLDWLEELSRKDRKAAAECISRVRLLSQFGHELRRPHADYLRDGIYELRAKKGRVNYRILYFFHGRDIALLAHGLTKEKQVPAADIERALRRKRLYEQNPQKHCAIEQVPQNPQDLRRP
jgi:phage-related protein